MDKFAEMKKESADKLGDMIGDAVEDSAQGIQKALACVFEHGSYNDGAKAVMIAAQWMWGDCESRYHAASQNVNK